MGKMGIYGLSFFILIFLTSQSFAIDIPSDKNYSPERDSKILKIFKEAESKGVKDISLLKLNYKKNRGYKVGGNLWNNEQWAYIAEIKNNTAIKLSCSIYLNVYDASGFLLDKYLLFAGHLQPKEIKNKSDYFFIQLLYIDQINSADISSSCITIP